MATEKSVVLPKAVGDHDEDDRTPPHMSQEAENAPSSPRIFQSWMAHLGIQTLDDGASASGTAREDCQHHGSEEPRDASQLPIIPTLNTNAGSSGTAGEAEHGYELSDLKGKAPISEQAINPTGNTKNVNHSSITIPAPSDHFCRICGPDETTDDPNNFLVDLGCDCKGSLSRMHRKCALEWFGPRIYVKNDRRCELCMTVAPSARVKPSSPRAAKPSTEALVLRYPARRCCLPQRRTSGPAIAIATRPLLFPFLLFISFLSPLLPCLLHHSTSLNSGFHTQFRTPIWTPLFRLRRPSLTFPGVSTVGLSPRSKRGRDLRFQRVILRFLWLW